MIYLVKSTSNTVVLTLNEKKIDPNCELLFSFTHDLTGVVKLFTAFDFVSNSRYNQFIISDNIMEMPYNGQMDFITGYWTYIIYEMPITSPDSLDPSNATNILEQGKVFVYETPCTIAGFSEGEIKDFPSFNPDCI